MGQRALAIFSPKWSYQTFVNSKGQRSLLLLGASRETVHYGDAAQNVFERDLEDGESEIKKGTT